MTSRTEEWQVLHSIYPELVPPEQPRDGEQFLVQVPVQFPQPTPVHIASESGDDTSQIVTVSHLPPVQLKLIMPSTYPHRSPPTINSIETSHTWLPQPLINYLIRILLEMWEENCNILGEWIEHVQDGDNLLSSLNLLHSSSKLIRLPNSSPSKLSSSLIEYNTRILESRFQTATHSCPICLNRLLGIHCLALTRCKHVACRLCLKEFWGSCIAEGDISRVGCPDPDCVREAKRVFVDDVKAIVTEEEFERWQWLVKKQEIEADPTITHCPVASCQRPVRPPSPAADERSAEWNNLRTCECGFAFCVYCRRAWHGPLNPCAIVDTARIIQTYLEYPEGSAERKTLDKRYGRSNMRKIIAKYEEEQANRKWLDAQTMACPGCGVHVQKLMGCNHMVCSRCRKHFCYLCGAKLLATKPYDHFNTPGLSCYFKLFDTQGQTEEPWVPMEGFE